jgi:hypothetical protein
MGCHTWFFNKIADIPPEHIKIYKERGAYTIRNSHIFKCTCKQFLDGIDRDLVDSRKRKDKNWTEILQKMNSKEYYERAIKKYKKRLELFESDETDISKLIKAFSDEHILFGKTLDDYYEVPEYGDNFRVYGYPPEKFYDAESAIKFLEGYDNKKITYEGREGMCDEIRDIITEFFNKYPNGKLEYG